MQRQVLTTLFCSLVLCSAVASAADITDYKTDAIAANDEPALQSRVDYYRPQLAAYRRAASQFARLPESQIGTRLVFL